jgi:plasminogen activator inhibitor 1 RNA-binding protein
VKTVEAGAEAGVVVEMVVVAVDVLTTSTVKLAKRMFLPSLFLHYLTSISDSDKKVHQGWGGDDGTTEFKTEEAATVDAAAESGANDWNAAPASAADDWAGTGANTSTDAWGPATPAVDASTVPSDPAAATPADNDKPEGRSRRDREPEEEDNTLTLSQYLAQQKEKDSAIPKLENTRKANEGASDDLWKDAVPLSKNEEEDAYFVGKVCLFFFLLSPFTNLVKSKSTPKARPKKEEKVYLEIDARFDRPERGGRGRGRGERGGDRGRGGRGGRGGPRDGGRSNGVTSINVDDQAAFPSLT